MITYIIMEDLLRNPGLQHIVEKSLKLLSHVDIASFRLSNQDCKNIVDYPRFYLMKLSHQENVPEDLIQEWKKLIQKLNDEDVVHDLILILGYTYGLYLQSMRAKIVDNNLVICRKFGYYFIC